jgi:hypothetical protein
MRKKEGKEYGIDNLLTIQEKYFSKNKTFNRSFSLLIFIILQI